MRSVRRYKENRWDARLLVGSGGLLSSHSATMTALAIAVGLQEGFGSPLVATAAIFASVSSGDEGKGSAAAGYKCASYSGYDAAEEQRWWPRFVPTLFVACIMVFIVKMFVNNCPHHRSPVGDACVAGFLRQFAFQPLRENPLLGPSSTALEKMGALDWVKVVHQHQAWHLISCIWLHAGLIHLIVNMLSLLFIGICLEQQFRFGKLPISKNLSILLSSEHAKSGNADMEQLLELLLTYQLFGAKIGNRLMAEALAINVLPGRLDHYQNLMKFKEGENFN
ncbi:hypothetical protein ABZP36_010665 [Zizania latifolia]